MKDELIGKIMRKFVRLRVRTYSYLTDDGSEVRKTQDTKKSVIKRRRKFESYKSCLEETQLKK